MKITKNFGFGYGKSSCLHFYLLPTIKLELLKDTYFTNGSWMLVFRFLHYYFNIGYMKLKNK
jgi:hypothetical protein